MKHSGSRGSLHLLSSPIAAGGCLGTGARPELLGDLFENAASPVTALAMDFTANLGVQQSPDVSAHSPLGAASRAGGKLLDFGSPTPALPDPPKFSVAKRSFSRHKTAAPRLQGGSAGILSPSVCLSPVEDETGFFSQPSSTSFSQPAPGGLFDDPMETSKPAASASAALPPKGALSRTSTALGSDASSRAKALFTGAAQGPRGFARVPYARPSGSQPKPSSLSIPSVPPIRSTTRPPLPGSSNTFLPSPISEESDSDGKSNRAASDCEMDMDVDVDMDVHSTLQSSNSRRASETDSKPSLAKLDLLKGQLRRYNSQPVIMPPPVFPVQHEAQSCILPAIPSAASDAFKRINGSTLVQLIEGSFNGAFDSFHIVDCRWEYEFLGGHIIGATNINSVEHLLEHFFTPVREGRTLIVFHCEFSSHRAPRMAKLLRAEDRKLNIERYPYIHYPEIYILEGGYKQFFLEYKERCDPQAYLEMAHKDHLDQCIAARREFKRNRSFHEAYRRDRLG